MSPIRSAALFFLVFILPSGCGGGGGLALVDSATGGGGGGIGGTGLSSTGTIDGFGSIFVNGVEFETSEAVVSVNGEVSTDDSLRLGMVVTVSGTVSDDGRTGDATRVSFDGDVEGPITAIAAGQDGDSALLTVLGVEVIAERTGTVFDGVSFDALAINDAIEVSGFTDERGRVRATRIEKKSDFVAGSSRVEVKGLVTGLAQTEFMLGQYVVDFSGADLSRLPGSTLVEGMSVEVRGTLDGDRITADRVEQEDDISSGFSEGDAISVQGAITDFVSRAQFRVSGVAIDASGALLQPANLVLVDGVTVEVNGTWKGGVVVATEVESRRGRVEIEASVASASAAENTITLQLFGGTVTVQVNSSTLLDDDTGQVDSLGVADITSGDFLEVEAIQQGSTLVATRVDRDEPDDDILQGTVERFDADSSLTVLGVTYDTAGASFEDQRDAAISEASFYSQLEVGDLVKIKDERLADGIADEVEFESDSESASGSEFDDDRDSDDDESDSDDDSDSSDDSGNDDDSDDDESEDDDTEDDDSEDDDSEEDDSEDDEPGDEEAEEEESEDN